MHQQELLLTVDPHPLLDLRAFASCFPLPLGELASSEQLIDLLSPDAPAPLQSNDNVRLAVRDLLRHGGFKPTGRSKPASEYLIRAVGKGRLSSINVAVNACNAVSLHSGLPISVIDLGRARQPFRVSIAPADSSYEFNIAGQVIDVSHLLCLCDVAGPCANAVKDAQRTKTSDATCRTLSIIWGTNQLPDRSSAAERWYRQLLEDHKATTETVAFAVER